MKGISWPKSHGIVTFVTRSMKLGCMIGKRAALEPAAVNAAMWSESLSILRGLITPIGKNIKRHGILTPKNIERKILKKLERIMQCIGLLKRDLLRALHVNHAALMKESLLTTKITIGR